MRALGQEADREGNVYFTGGATAVLFGWRTSTIAVDISCVPKMDRVLRALPRVKEAAAANLSRSDLNSPA